MQRKLISCSDGLDEPDPVLLGYANLTLTGIEYITEGSRLRFTLGLVCTHDRNHASSNKVPSRSARLTNGFRTHSIKRQDCPSGFVKWKGNPGLVADFRN